MPCGFHEGQLAFRTVNFQNKRQIRRPAYRKAAWIFQADTLGHLVYKYGSGSASVKITLDSGELACTFGEKASLAKSDNNTYIDQPHFIYIPPREMFSLFEGFISLYEKGRSHLMRPILIWQRPWMRHH